MSGRCGRPSARPWCRSAIRAPRPPFQRRVLRKRSGPLVDPRNWSTTSRATCGRGAVLLSIESRSAIAGGQGAGRSARLLLFHRRPGYSPLHSLRRQKGISEDQVFILVLDAAPDEATVAARAGFAVTGIQQRWGPDRDRDRPRRRSSMPTAGSSRTAPTAEGPAPAVPPALPAEHPVSLVWARGLPRSRGGHRAGPGDPLRDPRTLQRRIRLRAREPARRLHSVLPMRLRLNAPLGPGAGGRGRMKGPGGKPGGRRSTDHEHGDVRGAVSGECRVPARHPGGHQGRCRPVARQRRAVSAQGPYRRLSAAGQVRGALRHRGAPCRPQPARHLRNIELRRRVRR